MHLERGLTTTSTKKRKEKLTKARLAELEQGWRDRNVRLKSMGLPKDTFEQYLEWVYGKGKKTKMQEATWTKSSKASTSAHSKIPQVQNIPSQTDTAEVQISNSSRIWVTGPCTTKPTPTYTGDKIVGIATMHKSNAVPVFSDTEAKEVSSMRR